MVQVMLIFVDFGPKMWNVHLRFWSSKTVLSPLFPLKTKNTRKTPKRHQNTSQNTKNTPQRHQNTPQNTKNIPKIHHNTQKNIKKTPRKQKITDDNKNALWGLQKSSFWNDIGPKWKVGKLASCGKLSSGKRRSLLVLYRTSTVFPSREV